jgi:hypothetical protein
VPKQTIIANPCLADTSFLSNFVFTGNAALLMQVLNSPIYLTPVVLDPSEQLGSTFLEEPPQSELLKPLYIARKQANSKYVDAELPLQSFITGHNTLWKAIELTRDEERLALSFRKGDIWQSCTGSKRRTGLDPGEAETIAVALSRDWTLLIDVQAGVDLAKALRPKLQIIRTCRFLVHAVELERIQCEDAEALFNNQIRKKWGFYAKRPGTKEYLNFRCNPPRCVWQ